MTILIDAYIPYINGALEILFAQTDTHISYLEPQQFNPQTVASADALIVRTRTRCNKQLLEGSRVQFIGTATIGYDHIDTNYCHDNGIVWTNAPGCNANSVAEYVELCLRLLPIACEGKTIGIVGVGHVGSLVAERARRMGMRVLLNDPPRQEAGTLPEGVSLKYLRHNADVITFHIPLIHNTPHKTYHLADRDFLTAAHPFVLINTARGAVVDNEALLAEIGHHISHAFLDVWENEPTPKPQLIQQCFISTPHIAGYSAEGKANASRMMIQALAQHCNLDPAPALASIKLPASATTYTPFADSEMLKANPHKFEEIRNNYPIRREQ